METYDASNRRTSRNIIIYAILVFALGWLGLGLDRLMDAEPSQGFGQLIWILSPLGVSFLLRAFAGDGWTDLGIRPGIGENLIWYVVSILAYPVVVALVLLIGAALGGVSLSEFNAEVFVPAAAVAIVPMFVKNIFEEFGWRGYLAPKMYTLGLGVFLAHALVGVIWGAWHLPFYLGFFDEAVLRGYTTQGLGSLIPLVIVGSIAASIVYGEIRLLTNSVWPAVLMHAVGNAVVNTLLLGGYVALASGTEFLFSPGAEGVLAAVLFALLGVAIHLVRGARNTTGA